MSGKPGRSGGLRNPPGGRPRGSRNALPAGTVAAIRALKYRVPEGTAPEIAEVAGRAFERVVEVMEEKVRPGRTFSVLTAARHLQELICGPPTQKVEASNAVTVVIRKSPPPEDK